MARQPIDIFRDDVSRNLVSLMIANANLQSENETLKEKLAEKEKQLAEYNGKASTRKD